MKDKALTLINDSNFLTKEEKAKYVKMLLSVAKDFDITALAYDIVSLEKFNEHGCIWGLDKVKDRALHILERCNLTTPAAKTTLTDKICLAHSKGDWSAIFRRMQGLEEIKDDLAKDYVLKLMEKVAPDQDIKEELKEIINKAHDEHVKKLKDYLKEKNDKEKTINSVKLSEQLGIDYNTFMSEYKF